MIYPNINNPLDDDHYCPNCGQKTWRMDLCWQCEVLEREEEKEQENGKN